MKWINIITIGDMILICLIIMTTVIISIGLINHKDQGKFAEIEVDGVVMHRLNLKDSTTISVQGLIGQTIVQIAQNEARVISSCCPTEFCVKSGSIQNPGQMIVCVPNRVVVRIDGDHHQLDVITE
ncbi:NusG domain II-containing protein [candidate division KSB1 bacterium]|nr:NusG domain II-containing protein [candidate division KSB1 bacterium]